MEIVLSLIIIILIILVLVLVTKPDEKALTILSSAKLPYEVKSQLLNSSEVAFQNALKMYVSDQVVICSKVGLKSFIRVRSEIEKEYPKYFNLMAQKHVDFLLCDKFTYAPICAIELKKPMPEEAEVNESDKAKYKDSLKKDSMLSEFINSGKEEKPPVHRDAVVSKICKDASLPLITFIIKPEYEMSEFEELLGTFITMQKDTAKD